MKTRLLIIIAMFVVDAFLFFPASAQYLGGTETNHITVDENEKQHDFTYRSSKVLKITGATFDADARSLVFTITSSDEFYEIMELEAPHQTFLDLFSAGTDCSSDKVIVLADGMEIDYKVYGGDSVMWRLTIPPKSSVLEIIGTHLVSQGPSAKIKDVDRHRIHSDRVLINGTFTDECGNPIENGNVILSINDVRNEETTNEDGQFEFNLLAKDMQPGTYWAGLNANKEFVQSFQYDVGINVYLADGKNAIVMIVCDHDKITVFKSTNNYPACVKYETALKLNERYWTVSMWFGGSGEESNADPERIVIRGNNALDVCSIVGLACPSKPVFFGERTDDNNIMITVSGIKVTNVKQNQTHTCLLSDELTPSECILRK